MRLASFDRQWSGRLMALRQTVRGAPLVWGLTPYTLLPPLDFAGLLDRSDWPPTVDAERLDRYTEYEALVENRPYDVFEDLQLKGEQRTKIVLALALPELVCNVWADSVWTDPPELEFGGSQANDRWETFTRENDIEQAGWESIFSAAMRGTSVWKLHVNEDEPIEQIRLDEVPASIFFPTLKKGSDREFESVVLAWEEDRADASSNRIDLWYVREFHVIDDTGKYRIRQQEKRARERDRNAWNTTLDQPTELDFVPFLDLHGARWAGRFWGMSELARITSIVDEIDNRLSDIAEVLEYHGKPILQVPKSLMRGTVLEIGADRAFGIADAELADIARYITYDGKIADQISALDKLIELGMLTCEVPLGYFGMGIEGASVSGTALKLRLQNYLKKAARWQRRETKRLRQLGEYVMRIDGKSQEIARDSKVNHGSPLPADDEQEARIENLLTGGMPLSSRRTSIQKLRRVEDVDEELRLIEADAEATAPPAPTVAPGLAAAGVTVGEEPAPQSAQAPPPPEVA
jgi:hypothetical protein